MQEDRPAHPHFGVPAGPSMRTSELISAYLAGALAGVSPDAQIEELMLLAGEHPVAIRLEAAVLVREATPESARRVSAQLCGALEADGLELVEEESILANAVAMELAVPRGYEWSLWARDADAARAQMVRWALSEFAEFLEVDAERQRREAEMDAIFEEIERDW